MYYVQRMKKATFDWLSLQTVRCHHSRWHLLYKSPIYLLNTSCPCGELNATIRFGARLSCAKVNITKYLLYSVFFLNCSSNSLLRAWSRFTQDVVFSLITNRNISFISKRTWWWWQEIQREWNIKRPVKAYIQIFQCELIENILCQKLITTLRDCNHIRSKTTKTWLANVKRIFRGNNYLVLIGWDVKLRKLLPRTKI